MPLAKKSKPRNHNTRPADRESVRGIVSFGIEMAIAALAPTRCAACDRPVALLAAFCSTCANAVEPADAENTAMIAAFAYGGPVAEAVTRLKYARRPDLARPLGDLLWRAIEPHAAELSPVVVVPVPLHPSRLAERGFNQSALLACRVARPLGAPLRARTLDRTKDTPRQATLDGRARLANVAGAFATRRPEAVVGRTVLLVDDVQTTGATLRACAQVLLGAGAKRVICAVVARARPIDRRTTTPCPGGV